MTTNSIDLFFQYGAPVIIGILIGLIFKASITRQIQGKIRFYKDELVKCQSELLRLEHENTILQERLQRSGKNLISEHLFLN